MGSQFFQSFKTFLHISHSLIYGLSKSSKSRTVNIRRKSGYICQITNVTRALLLSVNDQIPRTGLAISVNQAKKPLPARTAPSRLPAAAPWRQHQHQRAASICLRNGPHRHAQYSDMVIKAILFDSFVANFVLRHDQSLYLYNL